MPEVEPYSKIKARLIVADFDCEPSDITKLLGINPSATWKKGEEIPKTKRVHKENGWRLDSSLPVTKPLHEHIKELLTIAKDHKQAFQSLPASAVVELACIVSSYHGDRPAIFFDRDVVRELAEINAEVDVDLYIF